MLEYAASHKRSTVPAHDSWKFVAGMLPMEPRVSDSKFVLISTLLYADHCIRTIGSFHVCTWVAEGIVLGRPLISTHLTDDDNRAFLYRILQALSTEGRTIVRVCLISYFPTLNWFQLCRYTRDPLLRQSRVGPDGQRNGKNGDMGDDFFFN